MTTAASLIEVHLDQRWPQLVFQRENCRPIAGTKTYSQHSWPGGNARDIFGPDLSATPASQKLLDEVYKYLQTNRFKFGIKVILWRVKNHFNHIHVDLWPTGVPIPPCAKGAERYRYSDGRVVFSQIKGIVKPEGYFWNQPIPQPPAEDPMTITQARVDVAALWHEKAGVWMSSDEDETAQQRLTRLAKEVQAGKRTAAEIASFAPIKVVEPYALEPIPAWVVDSTIPA